ncbi:helix-turn-helix domain-containing protein [Bradyrhizobium quebecense]|uniref:Helix-turn-helix transcriptional regulator n=1 Tax=Bradyrhizobium quebecense TaxID=2748629 RepID=A0A974AH13_9BRAD
MLRPWTPRRFLWSDDSGQCHHVSTLPAYHGRGHRGADSWPYDLSLREIQVLHLVATGASNPQIAQQLFVSPRTDRSSDRARLKRILPTASPACK